LKKTFHLIATMMLLAAPLLAQSAGSNEGGRSWFSVAAVIGMAIASGLCALGQGRAISGSAEGMARNPAASAAIRFALILGLILIESLALYVFAIIVIFK
jgi:F-type H+-transporting ATPase subunit c